MKVPSHSEESRGRDSLRLELDPELEIELDPKYEEDLAEEFFGEEEEECDWKLRRAKNVMWHEKRAQKVETICEWSSKEGERHSLLSVSDRFGEWNDLVKVSVTWVAKDTIERTFSFEEAREMMRCGLELNAELEIKLNPKDEEDLVEELFGEEVVEECDWGKVESRKSWCESRRV